MPVLTFGCRITTVAEILSLHECAQIKWEVFSQERCAVGWSCDVLSSGAVWDTTAVKVIATSATMSVCVFTSNKTELSDNKL